MKKIVLVLLVIAASVMSLFAVENTVNLNACKGCHGQKFEKKALGISKIVKDLNATEISKALIGYKNGTFGGSGKAIMKTQLKAYTNEDLKKIALQITKK